jgi:hypothetical protein
VPSGTALFATRVDSNRYRVAIEGKYPYAPAFGVNAGAMEFESAITGPQPIKTVFLATLPVDLCPTRFVRLQQ